MLRCVRLSKKMLGQLRMLSDKCKEFNECNEDFFEAYDKCSFTAQVMLRRKVRVLLNDAGEAKGCLWYENMGNGVININSMFVCEDLAEGCNLLMSSLPSFKRATYKCKKSKENFRILDVLGFNKIKGTLELEAALDADMKDMDPDGEFQACMVRKGIDEAMRCSIQNNVFRSDARVPLSVEDIYFDELQNYYMEDGAILAKVNDDYVGYGQIIIVSGEPMIVNLGILDGFRGKNYGKKLLMHLLMIARDHGFKTVKIRVESSNEAALYLYKKLGFVIKNEEYEFEKINAI